MTRNERDHLLARTRAEIKEAKRIINAAEKKMRAGKGPFDIEEIRVDLARLLKAEQWLENVPIEDEGTDGTDGNGKD